MTIEQFTQDLTQFIKDHPYTQELADGDIDISEDPSWDRTTIELHTVNGEYERIAIIIQGIP